MSIIFVETIENSVTCSVEIPKTIGISSTVLYVNKAMTATGMEINYEVEDELFGSPHIFFVDEYNVITDL